MLLTVIIPNFNSGPLLAKSLERLVESSISYSMEVLVLDNCSRDGSTEVVSRYADHGFRLRVESDRGVYDAMNKGIGLAQGDWLYFLGAGDLFFPERLQESDFRDEADFIYGEVDQSPSPLRGPVTLAQLLDNNICHQGIFYRKSTLQRYGGYELNYRVLADHILNIRLFFDPSVRKHYIPKTVAWYLGGGMSTSKYDRHFRLHKRNVILAASLRNPSWRGLHASGAYFGKKILGQLGLGKAE